MTTIHAYRRTLPHSVELFGQVLKFSADAEGRQVCEVPEGPALDRLLEISEGYCVLGAPPKQEGDEDQPYSPYVLTNGDNGKSVDLRTLDRAGLLAFIRDQELDYAPHPNAKDDTVRDKIVAMLTMGE